MPENMQEKMMKLVQGNPGALQFVFEASKFPPMGLGNYVGTAFERMLYAGITGAQLYMLWNDCCLRNTPEAVKIMLERDIEDIKDHISGCRGIPF